jgi:DnaK suppressor protein
VVNEADPHEQLAREYARAQKRVGELADALAAIVESSESANLDDEHDPEGATVGFERAQVAALLDGARALVVELEDARERVRSGAYGVCERCGATIPAARLDARPATRLCVTCASRA